METHYSISIIISILALPKLFLKPQLIIKLFSPLRTFLAHFHHRRKGRGNLELEATDIGPAQRTSPTSTPEVTSIKIIIYYLLFFASCYSLFTVLFHVICFLLFQLQERIQISFRYSLSLFNSYIIELLLRNPYSLVGAHSHKLG